MTDPAEGSTQALEDRDATIARLTAERDERQARVEALEAGLRPFAEAWSDNMTADDLSEVDRPAWESSLAMAVSFGDFYRAMTALNQTDGGERP